MHQSLSNRSLYPILQDFTYLNQASLGLICNNSIEAMTKFLHTIGRNGNIFMTDQEELNVLVPLRLTCAKLFNCDESQVAILSSASNVLSQLPYIFTPEKGSEIIMISSDFPSITRPWLSYSQSNDVIIRFIDESEYHNLTDQIIEAISERTSVVTLSHVQFSNGRLIDIEKIRKVTFACGAKLVVDVTQSAGTIQIDSKKWNADLIVASGYKWLGGHGGVAIAVLSKDMLEYKPHSVGWMDSDDVFQMNSKLLKFASGANRYTQSTISYVSVIGLITSINQILKIGTRNITRHSNDLHKYLQKVLTGSSWQLQNSSKASDYSNHIVSIKYKGCNIEQIVNKLKDEKIICSSRNGNLRVSLAHYNNQEDIGNLITGLKKID